jgi:hypothetical protein
MEGNPAFFMPIHQTKLQQTHQEVIGLAQIQGIFDL